MKAPPVIAFAFLGAALRLPADDGVLPELIVEAWGYSVLPESFAGNATVIDPETIANSGTRSVADLLLSEGGIRLSSTTGNRSDAVAHLRGFGENAAARTLVLIDGRPINRADIASVSWLSVPIAHLERVEILRGPHSARFGDNAVGGVINLITKRGGVPSTVFETAGGSDGYALARLSHRNALGVHNFAFDLEHNVTDGWRDNAFSDLNSAALRWTSRPAPGVEADVGIAFAEESGGFPGPLSRTDYEDRPRSSIYVRAGQGDQYFADTTRWVADATLHLTPASGPAADLPLSFVRRDLAWNFGPGYHVDNLLDTLTLAPRVTVSGDAWSLEAGLSYRRDALDLARFAEIERRNRTADAAFERDLIGLFVSGRWEPWDYWTFGTSARWEHAQVEAAARDYRFPDDPALSFARGSSESNTAFQAGVTWAPTPQHSAWLRYDKLYRLPSIDEIASYQGFPLSVPFNDQLEAETGHNIELGAEWSPGPWTFRANAFAQWIEGEIVYDFTRNLNVNLADTRRLGIETLVSYHAAHWDATLQHTSLEAEFRDGSYAGKQVPLVPSHEVTATLAWRPDDRLTVQAEYQWIGSSYEGNDFLNRREKLPAYAVANLLVRYEPVPGLSLYGRIDNLLDEHYATLKHSGVWYPAAGRQFIVGLRCEL